MSGQVKGWCPGALRPMRSGDGLLVRVRLTGGRLDTGVATMLAGAARRFGNGLLDLTSRGNLQLRGIRDDTLDFLLEILSRHGLLDEDEASEQVRNVMASPLAGLDPGAFVEVGPMVEELEARLGRERRLHALPAKFVFAIDDGGALPLDLDEADIGLRATRPNAFGVTAAGLGLGVVPASEAVEAVLMLADAFIALRRPEERRMRALMKRCPDALRGKVKSRFAGPFAAHERPSPAPLAGYRSFDAHRGYFAAAAPFGRLTADQVEGLAGIATACGGGLRLTPWRAMLLTPLEAGRVAEVRQAADAIGLITDPADPRLAIAACPGKPACLSGQTPAQEDAARLAPVLAPLIRAGASVHVSGCDKGCARRAPSSLTLIGRDGRYGLALDADTRAPGATPLMSLDEIAAFLAKNPAGNFARKSFQEP